MGQHRSFRELVIWQHGIQCAKAVYGLTAKFPTEEKYGLVSQMRRAAVSIPSNIAEGWARNTAGEFNQFLGISLGSAAELETLLHLARELSFANEQSTTSLFALLDKLRGSTLRFKSALQSGVPRRA